MKKNLITKILLVIFLLIITEISSAESFLSNSSYEVCFTPQDDCTKKIVDTIKNAKQQILIQSYSFTSKPIAKALIKAKQQGIDVEMIFDKEQYEKNHWLIKSLEKADITTFVDNKIAGLAHNKIIIIDEDTIITGSFNYTNAAQKYNAENIIILNDKNITKKYLENWFIRRKGSDKS